MRINLVNGGKKVYRFFRNKGPELYTDTIVGLTTAGRQMADDESAPGMKYDILVSLQHGEKTVGDLSRDIGEAIDDTKKTLRKMRGLVRFQDVE